MSDTKLRMAVLSLASTLLSLQGAILLIRSSLPDMATQAAIDAKLSEAGSRFDDFIKEFKNE